MMENKNLICDLETGVCGTGSDEEIELIDLNEPKKNNRCLLCDRSDLFSLLGD